LNFEEVGFVASKSTNSQSKVNYTFEDQPNFDQELFYRLKQVDLDGHYSYSPIVLIHTFNNETLPNVYPNPFTNRLFIESNTSKDAVQVTIYDAQGRKVFIKSFVSQGNFELILPLDWQAGIYFVQIGENQPIKLIKN
jgi:hypothetical protein